MNYNSMKGIKVDLRNSDVRFKVPLIISLVFLMELRFYLDCINDLWKSFEININI